MLVYMLGKYEQDVAGEQLQALENSAQDGALGLGSIAFITQRSILPNILAHPGSSAYWTVPPPSAKPARARAVRAT